MISCILHAHPLHTTLSHQWQQKSSSNTIERHVRGKIINFTCQYGTSLFDMMCTEHPDQCCIVKFIYRYKILLWGKTLSQIKIHLRNYWPTVYRIQTENSFSCIISHITELCKKYMHNGYRFATVIWCKSLSSQLNSIRGNSAHHDYKCTVEDIKLIFSVTDFFFTCAETKIIWIHIKNASFSCSAKCAQHLTHVQACVLCTHHIR